MAATRGDERTDEPVSVAELCRRLGPVPATADSVATGRRRCSSATCCGGRVARRSGRTSPGRAPEARRAPSPRPAQDDDPAASRCPAAAATRARRPWVPVASSSPGPFSVRRCWPLPGSAAPSVPQGDDGTGQFQGQGTLIDPGHRVRLGERARRRVGRRTGAGGQLLPAVHPGARRPRPPRGPWPGPPSCPPRPRWHAQRCRPRPSPRSAASGPPEARAPGPSGGRPGDPAGRPGRQRGRADRHADRRCRRPGRRRCRADRQAGVTQVR